MKAIAAIAFLLVDTVTAFAPAVSFSTVHNHALRATSENAAISLHAEDGLPPLIITNLKVDPIPGSMDKVAFSSNYAEVGSATFLYDICCTSRVPAKDSIFPFLRKEPIFTYEAKSTTDYQQVRDVIRGQDLNILLYMHGFSEKVYNAMESCCEYNKRPGRKYDLAIPVIWNTTKDDKLSYGSDRRVSAPEAGASLKDLLELFMKYQPNWKNKYSLMCHSMGNYVLRVIAQLRQLDDQGQPEPKSAAFEDIFMVAADVREDIFDKGTNDEPDPRIYPELMKEIKRIEIEENIMANQNAGSNVASLQTQLSGMMKRNPVFKFNVHEDYSGTSTVKPNFDEVLSVEAKSHATAAQHTYPESGRVDALKSQHHAKENPSLVDGASFTNSNNQTFGCPGGDPSDDQAIYSELLGRIEVLERDLSAYYVGVDTPISGKTSLLAKRMGHIAAGSVGANQFGVETWAKKAKVAPDDSQVGLVGAAKLQLERWIQNSMSRRALSKAAGMMDEVKRLKELLTSNKGDAHFKVATRNPGLDIASLAKNKVHVLWSSWDQALRARTQVKIHRDETELDGTKITSKALGGNGKREGKLHEALEDTVVFYDCNRFNWGFPIYHNYQWDVGAIEIYENAVETEESDTTVVANRIGSMNFGF